MLWMSENGQLMGDGLGEKGAGESITQTNTQIGIRREITLSSEDNFHFRYICEFDPSQDVWVHWHGHTMAWR